VAPGARAELLHPREDLEGLLDLAGARAALEERRVRRRVGLLPELLPHLHEQLEGLLRLGRLAARVDQRPVRSATPACVTRAVLGDSSCDSFGQVWRV